MKMKAFFSLVLSLCILPCGAMIPSAAALETTELHTGDVVSLSSQQIVVDCLGVKRSFDITDETAFCIDGFVGESWEDLSNVRTVTVSARKKDTNALRIDNLALVVDMGGVQFQPVLPDCLPRVTTVEVRGKVIQVLDIQQLLVKAGIDTGPLDGKLGPLTKNAIRIFQQQQGLPDSGQITPRLMTQLQTVTAQP